MTNAYDGSRGSNLTRRRRKLWLLETYAADVDGIVIRFVRDDRTDTWFAKSPRDQVTMVEMLETDYEVLSVQIVPACRCYRCGDLLTYDTVTVDRIIPGCKGGTYRRNNIRPSCSPCATLTGNELKAAMKQ